MDNLEQVIEDSINEATFDTAPEVEAAADDSPEPAAEVTEPEAESVESTQVSSPAGAAEPEDDKPAQDEFEKITGVPAVGVTGRENRIPYSRVKKITEKAVNEIAEAALGRKLNPGEKASDVVKAHVAQLPQLQETVKDYESRLNTVGEFEEVMASQPQRFLQMLAKVPAYKDFFDFVERAYNAEHQAAGRKDAPLSPSAQQQVAATVPGAVPDEDMPQPTVDGPDGTKVYDMDGLKGLLAWNAKKVEESVSKRFEERYKPMEQEWTERKRQEATLPVIRAQIAEAKTWPLFNENEDEIIKLLQLDSKISLDAAYRRVVFPKIQAERNKMREGLLQEIQKAPASTAIQARPSSKPMAPPAGPRSIEDIIAESIKSLK